LDQGRETAVLPDPAARSAWGWTTWLVVAAWAGLVAGFAELAVVVLRAHLVQHGLYRQSHHLIWMIPASNLLLVGAAGIALAALARAWPGTGARIAAYLLGTLALLPPMLAVPGFRASSSLILAGGLASWLVPAIGRRPGRFRRLVRVTLPPLMLVVLALAGSAIMRPSRGSTPGGPAASPPRGAPSVVLIVMDTVRADATSLHGGGRDTTPNLAALARRGAT